MDRFLTGYPNTATHTMYRFHIFDFFFHIRFTTWVNWTVILRAMFPFAGVGFFSGFFFSQFTPSLFKEEDHSLTARLFGLRICYLGDDLSFVDDLEHPTSNAHLQEAHTYAGSSSSPRRV